MADVSGLTKYFPVSSETYENNLSAGISAGAAIVPVNSAVPYIDGDYVALTVDPGTANEATFFGKKNGNQFEECVWTEGNTGAGHANGATIVDYVSATHYDAMSTGIRKEHNQDGTHKIVHADALYVGGVPIGQMTPPVGSVLPFAGGSAPSGWLLCDGSEISRSTYSTLFGVINTAYGAGDGSSTFNIPNLKGRLPVGKDAAQAEFDVMGETGGEKAHTLSTNEMPSHRHRLGVDTTNGYVGAAAIVWNSVVLGTAGGFVPGTGSDRNPTAYRDANVMENTGGGAAHNNLQPYVVMNYIIKV